MKDAEYFTIFARVKNVADADDITSEVFTKAFLKLETYRGDSSFSTWLFRIAYNAVTDHFRRSNRNLEESWADFFEEYAPEFENPESKFFVDENSRELLRALGKLKEREQRIIELKYWSGLSHAEIGKILNLSVSNVGFIHFQAMRRLRDLLK